MKRVALSLVMLFLLVVTIVPGCNGDDDNGDGNGIASCSVSNLTISPTEVAPNETATISVSVANAGGSQGSYDVVLNINGVQEETRTVTLAAGASESVTFSVTRGDAGTYAVTIGSLSGSFTVLLGQEIVEASIEAMAEVNTIQMDMDLEMTITFPGEPTATLTYYINSAQDTVEGTMHLDVQMTISEPPETVQISMEMYLIGDWAYMIMDMPDIPPEVVGTWFKLQIPEDALEDMWEQEDITNPQVSLLIGVSEVEFLGTETVNGVECYVLSVTPDVEKFWEFVLMQPGMEDEVSGIDPEEIFSDISFIYWIAKDTYFIAKSTADMAMTLEEATGNLVMTVLMYDINEPVTIELSPEAEAAEEITP